MKKRARISANSLIMVLSVLAAVAVEPVLAISNSQALEMNAQKSLMKSDKGTKATKPVEVGINAPTTFQTYVDPVTNVGPKEVNVSLNVAINHEISDKTVIEVPYGFNPNSGDPVFKNFSMSDPIFSFIDPGVLEPSSVVSSYENDETNQKLIIHLKKSNLGVETLNLRFKFNDKYNAKIPAGQIIWNNLKATVIDKNDGSVISESAIKTIKSTAVDGMNTYQIYGTPIDDKYVDGKIGMRIIYNNNKNLISLLDGTKNNRLFIEVPTGTVIEGANGYYSTQGFTSADDNNIPTGYTRYYRTITDDANTFNNWNYANDVNTNFKDLELKFTLPNTFKIGDSFHIGSGMIYTKANGEEKTVSSSKNFTKTEQSEFKVYQGTTSHRVADSVGLATVNLADPASVSGSISTFGWTSYVHQWTFKNIGTKDVKNTNFVVYQKNTDSSKINYQKFTVRGFTESKAVLPTYWKVKFEIKNALTKTTRTVENFPRMGTFDAQLPDLNDNEYIDKIHTIPMGADGITEGHLNPKNGIAVAYSAKNWGNNKWPDGTNILKNQKYTVQTGAAKYYDDETNPSKTVPTVIEQDAGTVYYAPSQSTQARAQFVSSNAKDKKPGETVDYQIQGYNEVGAIGDWTNPEVVVAVPKVLELQNPSAYKDFVDEKNKHTYPGSVKVTLVSSDSNYNYYKFNANGVGYKNTSIISFSIPVQFKVKSGAPVATYPIKAVAASHNEPSFVQLSKATNNLANDIAQKMGYDNSKESSYSGYTTGNTAMNVANASKIDGSSAGRKGVSDAWSSLTNFAVDKGSSPQMKATIENTGNTIFGNVRLYDILPSISDGRGSTGQVAFAGLDSALTGAKVYYTTKPVSDLPKYDTDLQTWNAAKLSSYGFTTTKPTDVSTVTAVFIDFDATTIKPNESLDTVLNFLVPNANNQKAINQFQYSAKEVGSETTFNANSKLITFSTEVAQVNYEENLPGFLLEGVEHATNIPVSQGELLDVFGNGIIKLSTDVPTLPGYEFVKWVDKNDSSKSYQPGENVAFSNGINKIDLQAVWKAKSVNVTYDGGGYFGVIPSKTVKNYDIGDNVNLADVTKPTRIGYTFLGWNSSKAATTPDFNDGTRIDFLTDKTVYAVWKANQYTAVFDPNGGTGYMADQVRIYDVTENLSKNQYTREGYIFAGWALTPDGRAAFQDEDEVTNLATEEGEQFKFYAVWKKDLTEIKAKDSTIHVGDKWDPKDNFVSAKDQNGNEVTIDKVTLPLASAVDTTKAGKYEVTYSYNGVTAKAAVTVLPDLRTIEGEDFEYRLGETKPAVDDFKAKATDIDGKAIDVTADLSGVNFDKVGTYDVVLKTKDGQEKTVKVVVKDIDYTVSFDANGGEGTMADLSVVENAAVNLPENTFTNENYTFVGWSTTADGKVEFKDGQEISALTKKHGDTVTLYAIWEKTAAAPVTVEHVDEQGNKLAEDVVLKGFLGESFTTPDPLEIKGYTYKQGLIKTVMTGVFTSKAQTISFVYVKDPVAKDLTKPGTKTEVTTTTKTVKTSKKALPRTGDERILGNVFSILGVSLLSILGLARLNRRKENK
ncbi:InlB B-repeat-containing protein [Lactobacillus sp. YT155]|uniref:InlB B-repeat-containing protein n=1 Tax=Lactobacillus sp. YT155 TaxID=3060955 RepID=UPI00265FA385|nr:InlB B-repeat-containing protein [Lactobacillus sp. YT155]MDO1604579.1 InlB B-repeat-containing protein [Lactobacillus sp. YT155]